jgi:two-component system sensor histidine kinase HydH
VRSSKNIAKLGRWALIAAPVLMGAALFATVWSTYRAVGTASETVTRGQSDILHDGVRRELGRERAPVTAELLAQIVEAQANEGLRWLAVLDERGHVIAEAGTPPPDRAGLAAAIARAPVGEPIPAGDRVRTVFRGPKRIVRTEMPRPPGRGPPQIVIEFDPRAARDLQSTARSTLAVGAVGASAFLVIALVLVRWLLRREAAERRLAQERRLASLGRMSAVLAHEIRNPLASLKGNAQLLARALPEGEKSRAKAERVVDEAVRLEALTNDLLEFAKTGELRRADVDPADLARDVALAHDTQRIELDTDRAPSRWSLDRDRIRQVLLNLVDNALQAGEGRIDLSVRERAGRLIFVVRDRGPGIPGEDLDRIFEPFFTRRTQGTGLGLAISRRLVELHGGAISAANADGGGAVFTVELPR